LITETKQMLEQAADLEHIASMLEIETGTHAEIGDIRERMGQLKVSATGFSQRATVLMAKISTATGMTAVSN
jgi:hypothetical protein